MSCATATDIEFHGISELAGTTKKVLPKTPRTAANCFRIPHTDNFCALKTQVQHFAGENVAWEKVTTN